MTPETLRNGIPLDVRRGRYSIQGSCLPLRVGDEALIFDHDTQRTEHVILLRGHGRKKFLVRVHTLREYLDEYNRQQIASVVPHSAYL